MAGTWREDEEAGASRAAHARDRTSRREQRWQRRRKREWLEELTGWILVPIIIVSTYLLLDLVFRALGTSVPGVISGIAAMLSGRAAP